MQEVVVLGVKAERRYYSKFFNHCNSQIQEFPELYNIFGDLSYSESKELKNNPVLNLLNHLEERESQIAYEKLQKLERALNHSKTKLSYTDFKELKSDLKSPETDTVLATLLELSILDYFLDKGFSPVPEPSLSNSGRADLKVPDSVDIYFEITNISKDKVESDVEDCLEAAGKELLEKLDSERYLDIYLDTFSFEWNQEGDQSLKQSKTKKKIIRQFEEGKLEELARISERGRVKLPNLKDSKLAEDKIENWPGDLRIWDQYGANLGKIIEENSSNPTIQSIKSKKLGSLLGPIESLTVRKGEKKAFLNIMGSYPEGTGEHRERRFLNQIENKLSKKLVEKDQREPGKPNLLIMKGRFWAYRGFTKGQAPLGTDGEKKVRETVENFLDEHRPEDLNAVVFVEKEPEDMIYIDNPHTKEILEEKFQNTEMFNELIG